MAKILIVEDDLELAEHMILFMNSEGFECHHASGAEQALEWLKVQCPDIILLDVKLPKMDGLTCCKKIINRYDVPVIFLTAKVQEIDRLMGLRAGADDYVCKPFSAMELILRIKAILRRGRKSPSKEALTLDKQSLTLNYQNNAQKLTKQEEALFSLLYEHPARIYSRAQILDLAYADVHDISERAIDSHIKNIRKKAKKLGITSDIIDSIYGIGYRYIGIQPGT